MSEDKFTRGNWQVCNHSWAETSIYTEGWGTIARLSIESVADEDNQFELEEQMAADARLIAASKEMFKALQAWQAAEAFYENYGHIDSYQKEISEAFEEAQTMRDIALLKVRGEQ